MRAVFLCAAILTATSILAGCASTTPGPSRSIDLQDDVEYTKALQKPDLGTFYSFDADRQAILRNEIVTARMYAVDIEFHYYEARLTRESQEEGLGATFSSLGLTTAATLVGGPATKSVLSGAAAAIIGGDKAYNEKELLSNSIQALQSQMRADRKAEAAEIYAKMFDEQTRLPTPIYLYTLPMALSDAENYYSAGTVTSALVGLSRTLANAEKNADDAKNKAGPNPNSVSAAALTAAPVAGLKIDPTILRTAHDKVAGPPARSQVKVPPVVPLHATGHAPPSPVDPHDSQAADLIQQIEQQNKIVAAATDRLAKAETPQERADLNFQINQSRQNIDIMLSKLKIIKASH